MVVAAVVKYMSSNFARLDKFEGVDFRRLQKKIHFSCFSAYERMYVLTTPIPKDGEKATREQIRKTNKWDNDDYVCRGLILNSVSDLLFDIYQNFKSSKELWIPCKLNIWLRMHQGFRQKSWIDNFDTCALVARISIIKLSIAVASIHNPIIHEMDVKIVFLNGELDEEVYINQPQGFIMPGNKNKAISQLEYSMVISCQMYAMTCRRPDIAFVVGKLSSNTEDNSSTSGWVFLLGGGIISWASKKQTCITSSTMEFKFLALAAVEDCWEILCNYGNRDILGNGFGGTECTPIKSLIFLDSFSG
nr:zinc finger, CCHC-type [Tanacetum cinerariifolium]